MSLEMTPKIYIRLTGKISKRDSIATKSRWDKSNMKMKQNFQNTSGKLQLKKKHTDFEINWEIVRIKHWKKTIRTMQLMYWRETLKTSVIIPPVLHQYPQQKIRFDQLRVNLPTVPRRDCQGSYFIIQKNVCSVKHCIATAPCLAFIVLSLTLIYLTFLWIVDIEYNLT